MIQRRPVTLALRALVESATGQRCGLVSMPMNGDLPVPPPYYILTPLPWVVYGAPLADENEDATATYQLTGVSGPVPGVPDSRGGVEQVEWLADKARTAVLGRDSVTGLWLHPLNVPGIKNTGRRLNIEAGATNEPEDATIPYVIRFDLDLTPA